LIIDEIGYIPIDRHGANLFFQLVSRRYERGAIILTSNQSPGAWGEVFCDAVIDMAILDRLAPSLDHREHPATAIDCCRRHSGASSDVSSVRPMPRSRDRAA
jgi:hypothetical protein